MFMFPIRKYLECIKNAWFSIQQNHGPCKYNNIIIIIQSVRYGHRLLRYAHTTPRYGHRTCRYAHTTPLYGHRLLRYANRTPRYGHRLCRYLYTATCLSLRGLTDFWGGTRQQAFEARGVFDPAVVSDVHPDYGHNFDTFSVEFIF